MSSLGISRGIFARWATSRFAASIRRCSSVDPNVNPSVNRPVIKEFKPTASERFYLVWSGKYKSMAEVPQRVTMESIDRAKSSVRIKVCNWAMALTLVGCLAMVITGKRKAERGETLQKMNLDWHKEVDAQYARDHPEKERKN